MALTGKPLFVVIEELKTPNLLYEHTGRGRLTCARLVSRSNRGCVNAIDPFCYRHPEK